MGPRLLLILALALANVASAQTREDLNRLTLECTANLRAVYGEPAREGRLVSAAYLDPALGPQTRAACQTLAVQRPADAHHLWLAYAHLAAQDQEAALQSLARVGPPPPATVGRVDVRLRAAELREVLLGAAVDRGPANFSHFSPLFTSDIPDPPALLELTQAGGLSVDSLLATLDHVGGQVVLLELYQGTGGLTRRGVPLGPDLIALRDISQDLAGDADPLLSIVGMQNAATYVGRGFEAQGLVGDPMQAQIYREIAFARGFQAWFDLSLPESYRELLILQVLPMVEDLLAQSQDPATLDLLTQAVVTDWAGLQSVQGVDLNRVRQRAVEVGTPLAAAILALSQADLVPAADLAAALEELAGLDACVYDVWARDALAGRLPEVGVPQATEILARGQAAGLVGAYVSAADVHRWGLVDGVFDFASARDLYGQAAAFASSGQGLCGRGDAATAHLNLAWMAYTGQGGVQDLSLARAQFHAAAQVGSFAAAEALAEQYLFGLGVPVDPVLAYDLALKANLWNNFQNIFIHAMAFYADEGGFPELGSGAAGQFEIFNPDQALDLIIEADAAGSFFGAYYLGLATLADPEASAEREVPWSGEALLENLSNHLGAFERGYGSRDPAERAQAFDQMRAELAGQINLVGTAARHDTLAAIHHDPARALTFYRELAADNPTAQALLDLDRFSHLSAAAQAQVGAGPITLAQVVDRGLADQLAPLPLHALMRP